MNLKKNALPNWIIGSKNNNNNTTIFIIFVFGFLYQFCLNPMIPMIQTGFFIFPPAFFMEQGFQNCLKKNVYYSWGQKKNFLQLFGAEISYFKADLNRICALTMY